MSRKAPTTATSDSEGYKPGLWEKILSGIAAGIVLLLVCFLVIRNQPIADPNLVVALRIIMSLFAAVFGATIPGFLHISWRAGGFVLRASGAIALFVLTFFFTPHVIPTPPPPPANNPTSLLLRMEREGVSGLATEGPVKGNGSLFEFTLANPLDGMAIVDEIAVEVLDVIDDEWTTYQGLVNTYTCHLVLDPAKKGKVPVAKGFKYAKGEVDRFSLCLFSNGEGHDYFVRLVVDWYDAVSQTRRQTVSDVMVARLPAPRPDTPELSRNEQGKKYDEQTDIINRHLEALRAKFAKE
jgi:hypothetical protein